MSRQRAINPNLIANGIIAFFTNPFPGTLSRQGLLEAPSLAGLQVVGVTLHFLNNVFRLNLALEASQGIL